MKRIILLVCILVTAAVNAQNIDESKVPQAVRSAFTQMYPAVSAPGWELENGKYEAEFTQDKAETSVIFESTGKLVQTEVEIPVTELPEAVKNYVSANLGNKKINEATKITAADGEIKYEIGIKNTDYLFDAGGSLLKSETEKDDSDDKK